MPVTYHCKTCNLYFEVGWYHFQGAGNEPYHAATLMTCLKCGTIYQARHGSKVPLSVDMEDDELFVTCFVQPEPITFIPDEGKRVQLPPISEWIRYQSPVYSQIRWDDIPLTLMPLKALIEHLICTYCGSQGAIAIPDDKILACPRCENEELTVGYWLT
jgi:hypothetical protein